MIGKRKCVICGKEFTPRTNKQVTCGGKCVRINQGIIRRKYPKRKDEDKPKTEHLKWDNDYGKHQIEQTLAMVGKVEK